MFPHFGDTRESPLYIGGWSFGGPFPFCCITEVVIPHSLDLESYCGRKAAPQNEKPWLKPWLLLVFVAESNEQQGFLRWSDLDFVHRLVHLPIALKCIHFPQRITGTLKATTRCSWFPHPPWCNSRNRTGNPGVCERPVQPEA